MNYYYLYSHFQVRLPWNIGLELFGCTANSFIIYICNTVLVTHAVSGGEELL